MNNKLLIIAVLILAIIVLATYNKPIVKQQIIPEKYCEKNSDCLTSCGLESGKGSCYNRNYVELKLGNRTHIVSPIDNVCCGCDYVENNYCACQNNHCITKEG